MASSVLCYLINMNVIDIAGVLFKYRFVSELIDKHFTNYLIYTDFYDEELVVPEEKIQYLKELSGWKKWNDEFYLILEQVVNALLKYNKAFYHGVAVNICNKCYIITAFSGTGKTTQYKNLKNIYPDNVFILNGDKPILDFNNEEILVYSSPWRGKERLGIKGIARLDGIIVLEQGNKNIIKLLQNNSSILHVLVHFLYNADTVENIETVCRMTERIIQTVPVWHYTNTGTLDSSRLLYDTLLKYQEEQDG